MKLKELMERFNLKDEDVKQVIREKVVFRRSFGGQHYALIYDESDSTINVYRLVEYAKLTKKYITKTDKTSFIKLFGHIEPIPALKSLMMPIREVYHHVVECDMDGAIGTVQGLITEIDFEKGTVTIDDGTGKIQVSMPRVYLETRKIGETLVVNGKVKKKLEGKCLTLVMIPDLVLVGR